MNSVIKNDDCLRSLLSMPDQHVDCVITSPPYNIGMNYKSHNDNVEDYFGWMTSVFSECERVLKDDGHLFLNIGWNRQDYFYGMKLAQTVPMVLQNNIIWTKAVELPDGVSGQSAIASSPRYLGKTWEHLFHFTKDGAQEIDGRLPLKPKYAKSNQERFGSTDRRGIDTWFIKHDTFNGANQGRRHPAVFPVKLPEKCIGLIKKETGIVLDPFAGTGTTGVACVNKGFDFIGIEIDEYYANICEERIDNARKIL